MILSFDRYMEESAGSMAGRKVLAAFSGGKDSCALLHWLHINAERLRISFEACHVNHMIRGENADRDEEFSRLFCERRGIAFRSEKRNVPELAAAQGQGLEHAARKLRYDALEEVAEREGYELILTAHTKDDMAETFFIRVFQGASPYSLGGIRLTRGSIYRPMLKISTEDVLEYIEKHGIETTFDETNLEHSYLRNWVRSGIIGEIKRYNPVFLDKVIQLMEQSAELDSETEKRLGGVYRCENGVCIMETDRLLALTPLEQAWVIRRVLSGFFRAEKRHVDNVLALASEGESVRIDLPEGFNAECSYGRLRVFHSDLLKPVEVFKAAGEKRLTAGGRVLEFSGALEQAELTVRTRRNGDRIGSKKLKDIFINSKTELFDRDRALIAEKDGKIIWTERVFQNPDILFPKDSG
ncbi:tRNA lysidine(34) synthetase TilS [Geovibrio thiophilus]|nr:tRNA lysidine(34) synthetase TilS [Geovibrio thiophilus]